MSFGNLPVMWSVIGFLALAGILYVLQRLRVRHQLVVVETAIFWRQAIEESRARVLVQRFRHPLAYLLLLLIAALLWFSVAGMQSRSADQRDHLVLIDGSAAMAIGDRFSEAIGLASDYANALPADARTVVLCAGRAKTLLRPDEESLLLARRLADQTAEACPSTVGRVLRSFAAGSGKRALSVCIVGDAALTSDDLAMLPESVEVRHLPVGDRIGANAGITALGVRAARSGQWHAVDVLVDVLGGAGQPRLVVGDADWVTPPTVDSVPDGMRYLYRDVPALGQLLRASLAATDVLEQDNQASFVLPDRRPIAVAVAPDVPDVVRRVVAADPGLLMQNEGARAAVRFVDSGFGGDLPALELTTADRSDDAFLFFHPEDLDPAAVLEELYSGLGLNEIDAMATAEAIGRSITMGTRPHTQKKLWVWQDLLNSDYDFVQSRSFPLFVGLGIRWLVDFDAGPERVAAGEPVAMQDAIVTNERGATSRSFSKTFVPALSGSYTTASGQHFAASVLDLGVSGLATHGAADLERASVAPGSNYDLVTALLLLALMLLGAEWVLYRTGRIP